MQKMEEAMNKIEEVLFKKQEENQNRQDAIELAS
jgi:hypothetical protein